MIACQEFDDEMTKWLAKRAAVVEWHGKYVIVDVYGEGIVHFYKDHGSKMEAFRSAVQEAMEVIHD